MALGSGQLVGQLGSLTAVAQLTVAEVRYSYSSQVVDHKQVTAKGTGPLFFQYLDCGFQIAYTYDYHTSRFTQTRTLFRSSSMLYRLLGICLGFCLQLGYA